MSRLHLAEELDPTAVTCADLTVLAAQDAARAAALWLAADPDPATRERLQRLLGDGDALRARLVGRLAFGTAGLRAALGAGPLRMNRLVVRQTTAGLVAWLAQRLERVPTVVVGHDARHGSAAFARDVAGVVAAAGGRALRLPPHAPTPYVAFAVRHLGADAGVQVTASHNPPEDNGYKVFLADGAQLPPPHDRAIAEQIDLAPLAPACAEGQDPDVVVVDDVETAYHGWLDRLAAELLGGLGDDAPPALGELTVVHTALHGVGTEPLRRAFHHLGLPPLHVVASQAEPDPDFPTVAFPNPEEPGALDHALATATDVDADVVFANDPDADRLAVVVRATPDDPCERRLTGDELGVLLADHALANSTGPQRLLATTVVSSSQLGRLAEVCGVRHAETLTGFKWIVRPALDDPDAVPVLAYEEAIGFALGGGVRDKDGLSAAVGSVLAAAAQAARGRTLAQRLDELAAETGLHLTSQVSRRFDGATADARRDEIMAAVRQAPPQRLADRVLVASEDLAEGGRLPPTDAVVLRFAADGEGPDATDLRVVVRPSGTEPKIKLYLEVRDDPSPDAATHRDVLGRRLAAVEADLGARLDEHCAAPPGGST